MHLFVHNDPVPMYLKCFTAHMTFSRPHAHVTKWPV